MRRLALFVALFALAATLAAACGDGEGGDGRSTPLTLTDEGIVPIPANSELVVGPNRFGLGLIDENNEPILGTEGTSVSLRFYQDGALKAEHDATFVWAIPDEAGFFVTNVEFDQAGDWEAEAVLTQDGEETAVRRLSFPVREESQAPNIGDEAPASDNLTLDSEPNIERISTDEDPDPSFYQLTVAEALDMDKPLVVIFATPAFCQTRFCGPILENVKAVQPEFADEVNFIHIEPFELDDEGQLAVDDQGNPMLAEATVAWNLVSEPWIFVIDAESRISARFEGAASPGELREAIAATTT